MQSAIDRFRNDSITTASPAQLLNMLYARLLLDLGRAEKSLKDNDRVEAHKNLTHAQDIIAELMSSLRMDVWEGSGQLMSLYVYAMKQLVSANVEGNIKMVQEIQSLFTPLAQAWSQASAQLEQSGTDKRKSGSDLGVG